MADINIERSHSHGIDDGRAAVEQVAQQLEEDLGVEYEWHGNTLHFEGQGANGQIEVEADVVHVAITLSGFLSPMRDRVETEAERYLDRHL